MTEPITNMPQPSPRYEARVSASESSGPCCQAAKKAGDNFCGQCGRRLMTLGGGDQPCGPPAVEQGSPIDTGNQLATGEKLSHPAPASATKGLVSVSPTAQSVLQPTELAAGSEQVQDALLCPHCGLPVGSGTQPGHCVSYQEKDGQDRRVMLAGKELTIGKDADCDLVIAGDDYVSRRHARLFQKDGKLFLEDLASSNGTFLKVRGPIQIEDGAEILVGTRLIRLNRTTA